MAGKKKTAQVEESGGGNEWLATYCDMVTLLFVFFVLLFAISQVDVQKFNLLASVMRNRGASPEQIMEIAEEANIRHREEFDLSDPKIPTDDGSEKKPLQEAYDSIVASIAASGMSDKVSAYLGDDYIFIQFIDDMLFEPNAARIRPQDYALLEMIGMSLKMVENDIGMIRIDGHTAALPENPDYHISDRDLSSERANAVLKYFENNVGIRGDRLSALAWGKFRPIAGSIGEAERIGDMSTSEIMAYIDACNDDEAKRRRNRRIEIMVTETNNITMQLDAIYEKLVT